VGKEVIGLCGAAAVIGDGKVVTTADETSIGGTGVVAVEGRVDVGGAFGGLERSGLRMVMSMDEETHLDHDEASTGVIGGGKVDVGLVVGDIEALNGGLGHRGRSQENRSLLQIELHVDDCLFCF
jgi:hypothetical protein